MRRSTVLCLVGLTGLLGPLSACVTTGDVDGKRVELTGFLGGIEDRAMICAPRELAEARANMEFASYEAGVGQTTRAWEHLKDADAWSKAAWRGSQGEECERDSDLDGIRDSLDACPNEPEDYDGDRDGDGCPELDADRDGIDDARDKCPNEPEDLDGFEDHDGCPDTDNDHDGIRDDLDQCPDLPEDLDGFQDIDGCPDSDNDRDGIPDTRDSCPNEPEDIDGDRDTDGCPDVVEYTKIVVTATRIELKQKVFFATNKARIRSKSYDLLNEVADALTRRAKIKVRIEGHTDSRGSDKKNRNLSQRRAQAVRDYLTAAGIAADRLVAVGMGEDVPIDTNASRAGRANNRRVEFHILQP